MTRVGEGSGHAEVDSKHSARGMRSALQDTHSHPRGWLSRLAAVATSPSATPAAVATRSHPALQVQHNHSF
jgi:hypothetical protein